MKIEVIADWHQSLMLHDWPECGPGSLELETLYQAFKARLIAELIVDSPGRYGNLKDTVLTGDSAP